MSESEQEPQAQPHGFEAGQPVWVEDEDGSRRPAVYVGENEQASWFGGSPTAYVAHPETKAAEVVPIYRIVPREE